MAKKKNKVLIVEDDPDLNDAFRTVLDKKGYKVANAFNGKEALQLIKEETPDLVLLDLLMPVMNGEEFLREFNKKGYKAPVVVFTNLDSQNDIDEIQKLGATRYLLKAWASPNELIKVVKDTLEEL